MDGSATKGFKTEVEDVKIKLSGKPSFLWREIGAWDVDSSTDKAKVLETIKAIEGYVIDHFYGDWYWNTVLPIGVCFFSWVFARIGFSFLWLLVVFLGAASVYRAEFRRLNRDVRDDMARLNAANRLENELETMEWLNSFLAKFWVIYMPALSEMVDFQANEILKDTAPGFGIEKLSLDEFTLGSKAPRVDSIKSYTRKGVDHIEMDWAFLFTPNDTDDMTKNEIKKKINPKVALGVTVGKAFISKSLPILVEDMSFTGRMNIKLKLNENFPHVKMVSVQFLEPPVIDYALKPVGGDTLGLDIMSFIPGLSTFVNGIIHTTLRPMLYAPNSLDIDVEELLAELSNDSNGVVAVTVRRVTNIKCASEEVKNNEIHPYVSIGITANGDVKEKTKVKKNVTSPVFMETKYILVNALEGNHLTFNVFHMCPDKMDDLSLGIVQVPLVDLLQQETQTETVKNITESGKVVGQIEYDLRYYPSLKPQVLDDGTKEENIDSEVGIMKLTVHGAKDLDLSKSIVGILNPYAEVYVNNDLIKTSRKLKQTNEPAFGVTFESLVTEQSTTQIQVLVKDSAEDAIVGRLDANLQDLVFESSRGQMWITAPGLSESAPPAKFRIAAKWKALGMGENDFDNFSDASIGGIRLHLRAATGLVNLESVGDVDPYVRIIQNGKLRAKTSIIANTSNPSFNNVYFLPIPNEHQHILLDILDAEPEGKDRPLGSCAISVKDFIKKNKDGYFLGYDGAEEIIEQPVLYNGRSYGHLTYSVSFVPTIPIYTQAQLENADAYHEKQEEKTRKEQEKSDKEQQLYDQNPGKYEWVEMLEDNLPAPPKTEMLLENVVRYRAGIFVLHILKGHFNKPDLYLHTLFDEHAYPSNVTPKTETRDLTIASSSEAFIRDLPNSIVVFRLSSRAEVNDESDIMVEKILPSVDLLKRSFSKPYQINLDKKNYLTVKSEFIPTAAKLAPLDTVLDVGHMKLEILSADDLRSVDSNGKSDPLAVIKLDGVEIFRTNKKRKTLDPVWNEAFTFPMLSRSTQALTLEIYDWDLTHDDELLGIVNLDLSAIPPNNSTQFKAPVDTQGTVHLRATFKPEYVRPKLSRKSGLGIDPRDIAGAPLGAVTGVAGVTGSAVGTGVGALSDGVAKGGHLLKGLGKRKRKDDTNGSIAPSATSNGRASSDVASGYSRQTEEPSKSHSFDQNSELAEQQEEEEQEQEDSKSEKRKQGAPSPEEQMEQNKPPSLKNAMPNVALDLLPPPVRPGAINDSSSANGHHRRTESGATDISTIGSSAFGADGLPGRINIVSASGFLTSALEVKATLQSPTKNKDVHKTRASKAAGGVFSWNETFVFKAPSSSTIVFAVREKHTFGKNKVLGTAELDLLNHINTDGTVVLPAGDGELTLSLRYVTTQL